MDSISRFFSASELVFKLSARKPSLMICRKIAVFLALALRMKFLTINLVIRQLRINKISNQQELICSNTTPIELLVVCSSEDLEMLPYCLKYAINSSRNPIERITVILPDNAILDAIKITHRDIEFIFPRISFIGEEQYIGKNNLEILSLNFPRRSGWILQQLLKFSFSRESESKGVLIVDADTLLLSPTTWLDQNSRQVLFLSNELHKEYFTFLSKIGIQSPKPLISNVTHHQLIQPNLLRNYCQKIGVNRIEDMIQLILRNANKKTLSPISIDYELYGQCIRSFNPNLVMAKKFSNVGLKRDNRNLNLMYDMNMISEFSDYDSVSLHGYIGIRA